MIRTIPLMDGLFEFLKNEKEDRSYSERPRNSWNEDSFSSVNGTGSLARTSEEEIKDAVEEAEEVSSDNLLAGKAFD